MVNPKKTNHRAKPESPEGPEAKRTKLADPMRRRAMSEPPEEPKTKITKPPTLATSAPSLMESRTTFKRRGELPISAETTALIDNALHTISTKKMKPVEIGDDGDGYHSTPALHKADDSHEEFGSETDDPPMIPTQGDLVPMEGHDRKDGGFPFLSLPPELRLVIYTHLFKFDQPVCPDKAHLQRHYYWFFAPRPPISLAFAMMCVNKQLGEEVAHFLYTRNRFFLPVTSGFSFNRIGQRNSNLLQHIIIDCSALPDDVAFLLSRMMKAIIWNPDLKNLRKLTFYDRWKCVKKTVLPRELLKVGSMRRWKMLPNLRSMHFDIDATKLTLQEKLFYERLCLQSRANITVGPKQPGVPVEVESSQSSHGVTLRLTPADMDKRLALQREEKKKRLAARREAHKRASELKEEEERKAQLEEEPKTELEKGPKA